MYFVLVYVYVRYVCISLKSTSCICTITVIKKSVGKACVL